MSGLLDKLREKVNKEVEKRVSVLEPKLDQMIEILKQIEENTRE